MNLDDAIGEVSRTKGREKRVDALLRQLEDEGRNDEADRFRDMLVDCRNWSHYRLGLILAYLDGGSPGHTPVRNWRVDNVEGAG